MFLWSQTASSISVTFLHVFTSHPFFICLLSVSYLYCTTFLSFFLFSPTHSSVLLSLSLSFYLIWTWSSCCNTVSACCLSYSCVFLTVRRINSYYYSEQVGVNTDTVVVDVAGIECLNSIQMDNLKWIQFWNSIMHPMSRISQPDSTINGTVSLDGRQVWKLQYLLHSDTKPYPGCQIFLPEVSSLLRKI